MLLAGALCAFIAQAGMANAGEPETASYRIAAIKWKYEPMARAQAFFEENRGRYAPGATLRFRLPVQVKGAEGRQAVRLLGPDYSEEIGLDEAKSFSLPKLPDGASGDTFVVADGYFGKGSYLLPVPEVRTPAVAPHSIRVGDVRLTCRTQVEYVRAYKLSWSILIGSLRAFSLDICADKRSPRGIKTPVPYNKVTWQVDDKIVKVETLAAIKREFEVPIGDIDITDDTTIAFELVQDDGPAEQETGAAH